MVVNFMITKLINKIKKIINIKDINAKNWENL